ncbi:hypothetical protein RHGRI_023449 [Rhododendron griersonianum]|uniref:CCHC-type domain-containing protein n=1 Tax=Rhododendron griersonianum TaxID=479676 RepID=A0AAV6J5M9_9ERIC|nr:hypothetical protein RHGRI_023449 [Rhododendron griersonianum]
MEIPEGSRDPFDIPEGSLEDEDMEGEEENPFHDAEHAEDYLDWEASFENYFEWKTMAEERKVLFVKLKLKGAVLQSWKRVEEQRARQGNHKISTWEKQRQMTSRYLSGLNQSIRDEMGVVHLFSLEDARQYALMAEKKVGPYGARRPLFRCVDGVTQRSPASVQGVRGQPTTSKTDRGATIASQTGGRSDGIEKGKAIAKYGSQNAPSTSFSRTGNNSQIRSFSCGEKGHTSYQCPQKWVNLAEVGNEEEEFIEPLYDEYDDEADDIDVLPIKGVSRCAESDDNTQSPRGGLEEA